MNTATPITPVADFWNAQSCGEVYAVGESPRERLCQQAATRYTLEPFIIDFAQFESGKGKDVLEVGVGMGADHAEFAKATPHYLAGIDLTERAVRFTQERLRCVGLSSNVMVGNAERLPFPDERFDLVYSWGVLHHSPNPARAIYEVFRVLRPGGIARVMIYHKYSVAGLCLWLRYGALHGESFTDTYAKYLESPGTHAYSLKEAQQLFAAFSSVSMCTELGVADLMLGEAGQRHKGKLLNIARAIWPRWIIRRFPSLGLNLLIEATK